MTPRKIFKKMHLWLSLPAGLIITIICISGAILSFETEILEWKYPERYFVEDTSKEKIQLNTLIPIIEKQLNGKEILNIKISSDPKRTYVVGIKGEMRNTVFVNPYTGQITGKFIFKDSSFSTIMSLHRWLLDGTRTWGKLIIGITTIFFVLILISGIVWWIPSKKSVWKSRFTIKTKNGLARLLYDLHLVLGIYVCLFLLLCSLTGLMWSFKWYRNGVNKLFGAEITQNDRKAHSNRDEKSTNKKEYINPQIWNDAYNNIEEKVKNYSYITITDGSATVLPTKAAHSRATDKYNWDKKTGAILKTDKYGSKKTSSLIMSWAYALHVGAYGGIFTRILTCVACIIGGTLPLTGYYIFYRKHLKKKKKKTS